MSKYVFYSHVDIEENEIKSSKLLKTHLKNVGEKIEKIILSSPVDNKEILKNIGRIIGLCHDFGKYTTFFQEYLKDEKNHGALSHHGFISAVFGAYISKSYIEKDNIEEELSILPLVVYFCILHHHGDLRDIYQDIVEREGLESEDFIDVFKPVRDELRNVFSQISNLINNKDEIEFEYRYLGINLDLEDFKENWTLTMYDLENYYYQLIEDFNEEEKSKFFILIQFLFSALIESDKRDAAQVEKKFLNGMNIPADIVDRYRIEVRKFDTSIKDIDSMNGIRNCVYDEVMKNISSLNLENRLMTITSPTGSGKTLTSLSAAIKLRERVFQERGYKPKIIYSLPFTSIIDQNYKVIEEVLSQIEDFNENKNAYLLKHHHLADVTYREKNEDKPLDKSLLLVEAWESEVIVTTFIQLLHTVIGFKNSFLKKYHNIAGSIIILDEVQNIPMKYWELVNKVFKLIAKHLKCYIILLTATKPLIFDRNESIELVGKNHIEYFKILYRNELYIHLEKRSINDFVDWFIENIDLKKSYLIVFNTISSSIEAYSEINERLNNYGISKEMYYLSSNIIPKQRLEKIQTIKDELENKPIVISTQMIEAGVDLDFDVVIRDIGPMDSIVQVAGRCNRSWDKNTLGQVHLFNLSSENGIRYGAWIYGKKDLEAVSNLLSNKRILKERQFFDTINNYFTNLYEDKNIEDSKKIWKGIQNFYFFKENDNNSISEFKLIEDDLDVVDVFVETDENAVKILNNYIYKVLKEKDFDKRRLSYLRLKKDFKNYIISVNRRYIKGLEPMNNKLTLYRLGYNDLEYRYKEDTGFYKEGWEKMVMCY